MVLFNNSDLSLLIVSCLLMLQRHNKTFSEVCAVGRGLSPMILSVGDLTGLSPCKIPDVSVSLGLWTQTVQPPPPIDCSILLLRGNKPGCQDSGSSVSIRRLRAGCLSIPFVNFHLSSYFQAGNGALNFAAVLEL